MENNYYTILGIERNATKNEIKEAYYFLVTALHPDKHPGKNTQIAEKKLKEINEAYEVLNNDARRVDYDNAISDNLRKMNDNNVYGQKWIIRKTSPEDQIIIDGKRITVPKMQCDEEYTSLTKEQYERIIKVKEATSAYALIDFLLKRKIQSPGIVIKGVKPQFNEYYYMIMESNYGDYTIIHGNTTIGELHINFFQENMDMSYLKHMGGKVISLYHDWERYVRQKNKLLDVLQLFD